MLAAKGLLSCDNVTLCKALWSKGNTTRHRRSEGCAKHKSIAGQEVQE